MTKDDIIGRIITQVHAEVLTITPNADPVSEGRANASARTVIVDRLVNDISKDNPDGLIALMEVLNERNSSPIYPEVRLLQQWQNMSILDTPMDDYYLADLLFSKQRAGTLLDANENAQLSALVDTSVQHPWPVGFQSPTAATTPVVAAPVVAAPVVAAPVVAAPAVSVPAAPAVPATTLTIDTPDADDNGPATVVLRTPVAAYREQRGMVEDVALMNGVAIVSGKEWRAMQMPRTDALLVADFDFATVAKEGVGRAAYLLVGPTISDDVRIELKSQSTSGSAGDKLPTSLLRLVNASKSQSYGSAVVGVVGLQYFAPEALTLAREVAARSSRVRLVEGPENFVDVVQQHVTNVKALHVAAAPALPENDAVLISEDAAYGGPCSSS